MPQIIAGVSGANRKASKISLGVSGANRECKEAWAGVSGTNRKVFESDISSSIKMCVFMEGSSSSTNSLQNLTGFTGTNIYIYNTAKIDETTGDIYIGKSGSSSEGYGVKFAAVSSTLHIDTINCGINSSTMPTKWISQVDEESGTWTNVGGYYRVYFKNSSGYWIGGSSGSISQYNCPDLVGYVPYLKYSRYLNGNGSFDFSPNYDLPTTFNKTSRENTILIDGTDPDHPRNIKCQMKIPNKSILLNGQPIDFLKCVRSTT